MKPAKLIKHAIYVALAFCLAALALFSEAWALEQIIKPYQGVRSSGMGGVKLMTGRYDENFFGNAALAIHNKQRVQLLDFTLEATPDTLETIRDLAGDGDGVSKIASTAGRNTHARIQTAFPAFYWTAGGTWHYALGLLMSTQADINLRRSFRVDPTVITDAGPAFTVARRLGPGNAFAVGLTTHLTYRLATKSGFSFVDLIRGASLSPSQSGGAGGHVDFDVGGTYDIPWKPAGWELAAGASINQLLGGRYSMIKVEAVSATGKPQAQPRTYGLGVSARKPALWIFTDAVAALEIQDIGNNPSGSLFRTVHLGGELRYGVLAPRFGLNQGYWAAGLGILTQNFEFELASYGEELSLNVGGVEDRRYVLRMGVHLN